MVSSSRDPQGATPFRLSPVGASHLTVLFLALLLLSSCKPPEDRAATRGDPSVRVSAELNAAPKIGSVSLSVNVSDESGAPLTGATVKVVGDMTHAGMTPVLADAPEVEDGHYRADEFAFTMAGDWIITITVTTSDGKRAGGELLVTVPSR